MENIFKKFYPKAILYLNDKKRLKKLLSKATDKSFKLKDQDTRNTLIDDIKTSTSLLKDWSSNEYTNIPTKSILSIIVAIIYFIIPTDLIPDFILGTGFLDDAAVISYMFSIIKDDINNYKTFKTKKNSEKELAVKLNEAFLNLESVHEFKNKKILEIFMFYFQNNEFEEHDFISFLLKNKNELIKNGFDSESFSLIVDVSKFTNKKNKSNMLIFPITAYSIIKHKEEDNLFFENIKKIIKMSYHNEEIEEIFLLYASIIKKIFLDEKDKRKLLLQHDFNSLSFKSKRAFELGMGGYIHKENVNVNNGQIDQTFEFIVNCLYRSNSLVEVLENKKEDNSLNYSLLVFLSSSFFKKKDL